MANEIIIKDQSCALQDADELTKNAKNMKGKFDELSATLKGYTQSNIRLDWMDTVVQNFAQYNENDVRQALEYICDASENIKNYVSEALKYSHEEQV